MRQQWNKIKPLIKEATLAEDIYNKSIILNRDILSKYASLRKIKYIKSEDDTQHVSKIISLLDDHEHKISFSEAAILSTAKHYWIEGGYIVKNRGPEAPGNQIDLPRGASSYFGFTICNQERNTFIGEIDVSYRRHSDKYPLRLGNNYMEKLSLPIPGTNGPRSYENTVLLFSKIENNKFKLDVQPTESSKSQLWERKSRSQRTCFAMRSGRKFGVFD